MYYALVVFVSVYFLLFFIGLCAFIKVYCNIFICTRQFFFVCLRVRRFSCAISNRTREMSGKPINKETRRERERKQKNSFPFHNF